jgi:hypothetical protein
MAASNDPKQIRFVEKLAAGKSSVVDEQAAIEGERAAITSDRRL